jgi:osmotically-inducible protein OsmY
MRLAKQIAGRRRGHSTRTVVGAFGIGAAAAFVLSKLDRRRRHEAADRTASAARGVAADAARKAEYAAGHVKGAAHAAASPLRGEREYDDNTLARKVESELFRPPDAPKDRVSVNVANGVVELRGQVDDAAQIDQLGDAVRKIDGVKDVRNLLQTAS